MSLQVFQVGHINKIIIKIPQFYDKVVSSDILSQIIKNISINPKKFQ